MQPDDTSIANDDAPADPLRLDRCPECGYLLTGLPEQGICPECGFAYRPEMIVLYGWSRHVRGDQGTQRWGHGRWIGFAVGWGVILFWIGLSLYRYFDPGVMLLFLVLAGSFLRIIYRRLTLAQDVPAPVQVRLQPEGFGQRDGVGPVKLRPWRANRQQLIFESAGPSRCRIRSWRHLHLVLWRSGVIDFEFDCDAETMERIQERIRQWRQQAQY